MAASVGYGHHKKVAMAGGEVCYPQLFGSCKTLNTSSFPRVNRHSFTIPSHICQVLTSTNSVMYRCSPGIYVEGQLLQKLSGSTTRLCSASYISCQSDTARISCWMPCCSMLAAGRAAAAAVDRYLLPTWCSAANWPWLWSNDGTDRQMDGRETVYRPCSALLCKQCQ